MKLLIHLQQINNVKIIKKIVKLQGEVVRVLFHVVIIPLQLHVLQIHHANGQDNADPNQLHVVH